MIRTVDVSGLSEEAVAAVENLVALLRQKDRKESPPPVPFSSRTDWCQAILSWTESHPHDNPNAEWDRESIYAGSGE